MKKHTKIYMDAFGYGKEDFIPCEMSGKGSNDVHHIEARGMGGDPNGEKDRIENLMAIDREIHVELGDDPKYMAAMYSVHRAFLISNKVEFDQKWMQSTIDFYKRIKEANQKIEDFNAVDGLIEELSFSCN